MRTKSVTTMIIMSAIFMTAGVNNSYAAVSVQVNAPNVSFSISDYQPVPPNVYIHNNNGRPYYVERDRRVYMEKKNHGKGHKKEKKHHKDNGHKKGHDKHGN